MVDFNYIIMSNLRSLFLILKDKDYYNKLRKNDRQF